jgi:hypothetical protein
LHLLLYNFSLLKYIFQVICRSQTGSGEDEGHTLVVSYIYCFPSHLPFLVP